MASAIPLTASAMDYALASCNRVQCERTVAGNAHIAHFSLNVLRRIGCVEVGHVSGRYWLALPFDRFTGLVVSICHSAIRILRRRP